jgi:hypothetical protein
MRCTILTNRPLSKTDFLVTVNLDNASFIKQNIAGEHEKNKAFGLI